MQIFIPDSKIWKYENQTLIPDEVDDIVILDVVRRDERLQINAANILHKLQCKLMCFEMQDIKMRISTSTYINKVEDLLSSPKIHRTIGNPCLMLFYIISDWIIGKWVKIHSFTTEWKCTILLKQILNLFNAKQDLNVWVILHAIPKSCF